MLRVACWLFGVVLAIAFCASCTAGEKRLPPPFRLTPDEEKNVARQLARWEQWNAQAKTFDCRFKRWTYDGLFGQSDAPKFVDLGAIHYAAPDRWFYRVAETEVGGKPKPIENNRAEHWIFNGRCVWEYNYTSRHVLEHRLSSGDKKTQLVRGPLTVSVSVPVLWFDVSFPIPYGDKAASLKERYYIRENTPADVKDKIWLEASPRTSLQRKFQLICQSSDMSPYALRIVELNGKDYAVYQFYDAKVNAPAASAGGDPFQPTVPEGWKKITHEPPMPPPKKK